MNVANNSCKLHDVVRGVALTAVVYVLNSLLNCYTQTLCVTVVFCVCVCVCACFTCAFVVCMCDRVRVFNSFMSAGSVGGALAPGESMSSTRAILILLFPQLGLSSLLLIVLYLMQKRSLAAQEEAARLIASRITQYVNHELRCVRRPARLSGQLYRLRYQILD